MVRRHWRGLVAGLVVLVALGALAVAVRTDVSAHARDRQEHKDLVAASRTLASSRRTLQETTFVKAVTTSHRNDLQASDTATLAQLSATTKTLSTTDAFAFLQGIGIDTLQTCLGGIQALLPGDRRQRQQQGGPRHLLGLLRLPDSGRRHQDRPRLPVRLPRP